MVRMASFQLADSLFFKTFIKLMSKKKRKKLILRSYASKQVSEEAAFLYCVFLNRAKLIGI